MAEVRETHGVQGVLNDERVYALPPRRVLYTRIGAGFLMALIALFLIGGNAPLWLWLIDIPALIAAGWYLSVGIYRLKSVRETPQGLVTSYVTGGKLVIPWEQIDRFDLMPLTRGVMVCAVDPRGRRTAIVGLDASVATRWQGGETDDIVAELNTRLKHWRTPSVPVHR